MKTSDFKCKWCDKKADDGYAIYRTSPKGQPFEGVCFEHREFSVSDSDIAKTIEKENFK